MIIIPVKNKNIEQALKAYKFKIYKTKQIQKLQERKEYKKPSVERRAQIQKAVFNQKNYSADWSSVFLEWYFLPKITSVEVKPNDPNASNAIESTNVSSGQSSPLENKVTNNEIINDKTQITPTNLFEECVVGPDPINDLKNFIIIQNLIFLVYINYNDLL